MLFNHILEKFLVILLWPPDANSLLIGKDPIQEDSCHFQKDTARGTLGDHESVILIFQLFVELSFSKHNKVLNSTKNS